jgi:hypothetical protein
MIKNTWVNLPAKSLNDSVEFFEKLGFKFNKQFNATNMLLNDNTMVTLVEEPQFKEFAQKEVADTKTNAEAVLVLQVESKDAVNELLNKAISLGAKETRDPHEHGPMFGRSFEDLDGHVWEVFFMNEDEIPKNDEC